MNGRVVDVDGASLGVDPRSEECLALVPINPGPEVGLGLVSVDEAAEVGFVDEVSVGAHGIFG